MRTVVVGASSGLGRCIGVDRGRRGDRVALLARRLDRLTAAAADAGPGNVGIECDVTDETSCRAAVRSAAEHLGGIDALVYAPGIGQMRAIEDIDVDTWRHTFATNVIGAATATSAALPFLLESGGVAAYLSSISTSMGRPWPGLASYTVSKAALDRLIEAFRVEHPTVGFTRVVVGDCAGGEGDAVSEFSAGWDFEAAGRFMEVWAQRGYLTGQLMDVADLLDGIDLVLRSPAGIPSITLGPRLQA